MPIRIAGSGRSLTALARQSSPLCLLVALTVSGCPAAQQAIPTTQPLANGSEFRMDGATIALRIEADHLAVSNDAILKWAKNAAHAVTLYLGRFPVRQVDVVIQNGDAGDDSISGVEYEGRRIVISMNTRTRDRDLDNDWVLTHEMFHLAFPQLPDDAKWANEGLSVYLEPLARAQNGTLRIDEMWLGIVRDMPNGLPAAGDRGLDNTHTWGRTYWGGTLFWLMADMQIRVQTHGHKSLLDALLAILNAGGNGGVNWELQQALDVGDRATGTHVLNDIHDQYGRNSQSTDLNALWKSLGVAVKDGRVVFDDGAPLASIRRALTTPR